MTEDHNKNNKNNNNKNNNNKNNNPPNNISSCIKEVKMHKKKNRKNRKNHKMNKRDKIKPDDVCLKSQHMHVSSEVHWNAIKTSLIKNIPFYLTLLYCLYLFTKCHFNKSSIILSIISAGFISFYGYMMHVISHSMKTNMTVLYKKYDNMFTRNKYINWLFEKALWFGEFHDTTHHNSSINRIPINIFLEFVNNIVTQGGILLFFKLFLSLIDNRVIFLWSFFYATVHIINYSIIKPVSHAEHHINNSTNYGIDIWDIIIGSKYDWTHIEAHNHGAINLLCISAVIIYISNKFKI